MISNIQIHISFSIDTALISDGPLAQQVIWSAGQSVASILARLMHCQAVAVAGENAGPDSQTEHVQFHGNHYNTGGAFSRNSEQPQSSYLLAFIRVVVRTP